MNGAAEAKRPITRLPAAAGLLALLPALQLLMGCQPPHPAGQLVVANKSSLDSVDPVDVYLLAGTQLLSAVGDPCTPPIGKGNSNPGHTYVAIQRRRPQRSHSSAPGRALP